MYCWQGGELQIADKLFTTIRLLASFFVQDVGIKL
jgi:hypothetical protein